MPIPLLYQPVTIAEVTFRNRIIVSPMCQYRAHDGRAGPWHQAHYAHFALGGVGGAIIEATGVTPDGRITPGCLGLWSDAHIAPLAQIVGFFHDLRIPIGIQIAHAGRKASSAAPWDGAGPLARGPNADRAWQTVAPSAVAHAEGWPEPKALEEPEIDAIVAAFAAAARRAIAAGFDLVEIHGAHGYLIHSFLSPLANMRTDAYGGSLQNRMRFALHVAEAVRREVPLSKALFFRASAVDAIEGGIRIEDTIELARELKLRGVDVIDVSSGGIYGPVARSGVPQLPGHQVPYASAIRSGADIATMAVGLITDPDQAEAVLAEGHADLVALGRELLADPNFAYRAARALKLEAPESVLPAAYAFYLARRK